MLADSSATDESGSWVLGFVVATLGPDMPLLQIRTSIVVVPWVMVISWETLAKEDLEVMSPMRGMMTLLYWSGKEVWSFLGILCGGQ